MSQALPPPTDDEIIASAEVGTIVCLLADEIDHDLPDSLVNRAAALHNAGQINLLGSKQKSAIDRLDGHVFFTTQQMLCELIPKLDAPVADMMVLVKQLVEKGGMDLAAQLPLQAFKVWLANNLTRVDEILAAFRGGSTDDAAYLAAALEARGDPALVFPFLKFPDVRRQFAASALGSICPADEAAAAVALTELLPLAQSDSHDMTRFTALYTMAEILSHTEKLAPVWVPQIIAAAKNNPSNSTCEALLQGVWRRTKLFDDQQVSDVIALAMARDMTDERLLNLLANVLGQLVGTVHRDKALDALTTLVEQGTINLEENGPILYQLHDLDRLQRYSLVVRWLNSGVANLCQAAVAVAVRAGQAAPFDGDLSGSGLTSEEIIALCQRAVGYLFIHPVAAASIVVAGLRAKDAKATPILTQLLYFPLLMNYLGSVQDYLKTIKKGDAAWAPTRKALKQIAGYTLGLTTKEPIKELSPSDYQLNIARERRMEMNREIYKQVRKESVLLSFVHQSTVLYGRSTMTYLRGTNSPPVTMEMKAFSHSFEVPRLDILDPVGLAWMLRQFRMARP